MNNMYLHVRVTPYAKQSSYKKERDLLTDKEIWYVRLQAKPVDGEANKALIAFVADVLDVPKRNISLVSGQKSRRKILKIQE